MFIRTYKALREGEYLIADVCENIYLGTYALYSIVARGFNGDQRWIKKFVSKCEHICVYVWKADG